MTTLLFLFATLTGLPGCQPVVSERLLDCVKAERRYSLALPAGFTVDRKWPALVILHGDGRNHRTLLENAATRERLLEAKSVLVLPDGGRSWWRDEVALLDLLDWLTPQLNLDVRHLGCSGWSMGGYGSLRLVTHHPDRFAAWGGIIGVVDFPNAAYPKSDNYRVPAFFGTPDQWPASDPLHDFDALHGKAVWFATARGAFDAAMNRELDRVLTEKNITHSFEVIEGGHDFASVTKLLGKLLEFFERSVS